MDDQSGVVKPPGRGVTLRPCTVFKGIVRMSRVEEKKAYPGLCGYWVEAYFSGEREVFKVFRTFHNRETALGGRSVESDTWNEDGCLVVIDPDATEA
tara:strand:+ start:1607 stop:1897 length:291 start_codon:yes stop_codon:yes gene_type:complete